MKNKAISLCNLSLVPRVVSTIRSRDSQNISTNVTFNDFHLSLPIIASPMKDVCNGNSGNELMRLGCFGIIHRFYSIEEQVAEFKNNIKLGAAIGVNGDCLERFDCLREAGCKIFCIDVANGASVVVEDCIAQLLQRDKNVRFIVGNVASKETFRWASKIENVIGVRVGIAGGSACTTKNATGIYHPMASLLMECKSIKDDDMPLIIADGGIKEPSDFCKAIAVGADCVMLGSVLAVASDSPAEILKKDGFLFKMYHGSASFEIQKIYRDKPRYIEGKTMLLPFENETLEQIITKYKDGLRSSMSYFNALNIKEFQENCSWCTITDVYGD